MKAAIKTPEGRFEIKTEVSRPRVERDDWVVARVKVAGICGTDLRHWKKKDAALTGKIMGHELGGEIVEIGPAVRELKVGDRVVIETLLGDESCPWCRVRSYNLCPHLYEVRMRTVSQAFAEYVAGPAEKFYKLPDHVSYEESAVLDTFSVCLHAIQLSGLRINEKVAIIGAGPIGLGQVQLAKLSGADVIVTDVHDHALEAARELGADVTVNVGRDDAAEKVKQFTGGRGVDVTFECAGGPSMPKTLAQAVSFTRIGGRVVIVGGFEAGNTAIEIDWQHLQKSEIRLLPSASYSYWGLDPEMKICLDLVANGKLNAKRLITHRFPIDQINEAFDTADRKEETKAIFVAIAL